MIPSTSISPHLTGQNRRARWKECSRFVLCKRPEISFSLISIGRNLRFAFRFVRPKQRCNLRNLSPLPMMAERALKKRPAVTSSRYCDDVLDRMHDPFDLVCQLLEGVAHLLKVLVAVVNAANAADGMTAAALGGVGVDARARHQRACRASQVVK